ncbi:MAG: N4-(beta-N-acetylglucosaminyl)-L-asparaginase, partial [Flavobacteriaceae bacterium]
MKRRKFLKRASLTGIGFAVGTSLLANISSNKVNEIEKKSLTNTKENFPIVISTWNVPNATKKAGLLLEEGSSSIDAIEKGCMVEEA